MIRTVADIARIMEERDIPVMSIRRPSEKTNGKWQVSFLPNDFRINWTRGKLKPDFISALEACFGEKVEIVVEKPSATDIGSLLE